MMFHGVRPDVLKPLTKEEKKSGKIPEVWIEATRWFDARTIARRLVSDNVQVAMTDMKPPAQAYKRGRVFRLEWVGRGGSQTNPLSLLVHEVKKP